MININHEDTKNGATMRDYRVYISGEGTEFHIEFRAVNEYECRTRVQRQYAGFWIDNVVEVIG